jgi:hypothetical protein
MQGTHGLDGRLGEFVPRDGDLACGQCLGTVTAEHRRQGDAAFDLDDEVLLDEVGDVLIASPRPARPRLQPQQLRDPARRILPRGDLDGERQPDRGRRRCDRSTPTLSRPRGRGSVGEKFVGLVGHVHGTEGC